MKKIATRFGMYGVAVMILIFGTTFMIFRGKPNWDLQEVIGYFGIVLSLIFVYFGIRRWRDTYNNGRLGFWNGIGLGTFITLFPSVAFGVLTWIELLIDPGFNDKYYNYQIDKLKKSVPPEKLEAALKEIAEQKEMFSSPFAQFFFMFITVFLIGFVITIISTLILRRSRVS